MRRNSKVNPFEAKRVARQKYGERQLDKWLKWRWRQFGKIRYVELIQKCKEYKI